MRRLFLPTLIIALFGILEPAHAKTWEEFFASYVRTRAQWGAADAKPDMPLDATKQFFVVHHTAGSSLSLDATIRSIQAVHMGTRGFSDIGYHFLIGPDGKIFEGRSLAYAGAHVLGHNKGSIGVNFLGCYDSVECHAPRYPEVESATEPMIDAMAALIQVLSAHFGIEVNATTVMGHREFSGAITACPGDRVMARMDDIRTLAGQKQDHDHDEL